MSGVDSETGKAIEGAEHIRQSVIDILTTRIGERIMRPDYGSDLPNMVDMPINELNMLDMYSAVIEAITKHEPRYKVERVYLTDASEDGLVTINLTGINLISGEPLTMEGITI